MEDRNWDDLTDKERIQKLYESVQTLALQGDALKQAYREQAARIGELEGHIRTLESHLP